MTHHTVHPRMRRRCSRPGSTSPLALSTCLLVAMVIQTGCSSPDESSDGGAQPSAASDESARPPLSGRLMFSRFDEATHSFVSTHLARPDGTDETELELPGPEGGGRWSRSGTEIAVMTIRDDDRIGTAIITPDGTVERVLEIADPALNLVCVVWSPDDTRLACEGWDETDESRNGIYSVDASDGGDLQRITTSPAGLVDYPGDYSPDGTQLTFLRTEDEQPGALMVVDPAGGEPHELAAEPFDNPGRFSPDGASLLTAGDGGITILDLDGEIVDQVIDSGADLFGGVWSPDGQWIAYSRSVGGPFADLYISRPDGRDRQQVTDTPDNEAQLDWGAADPAGT